MSELYLKGIKETDPEVYGTLERELNRQQNQIELIASENFTSKSVLECLGSIFTNKYSEGQVGNRYYGGCQIIDEVEPTRRGTYGGAVGYFSFSGNADTAITIRTIVVKDGIAHVQAGGGIVADSISDAEFEETVNKAKAVIRAIEIAHQ